MSRYSYKERAAKKDKPRKTKDSGVKGRHIKHKV